MVWPKPLTLALMRVVCFEASISQTSFAGIPFARARLRMGAVTLGSSRRVTLLKMGTMNTGTIITENTMNSEVTIAPQIHQADQPSQAAGQAHCNDPDSARINARGTGGRIALSHGANLESRSEERRVGKECRSRW